MTYAKVSQNADNAKSDEMLIELNTEKQTLLIANKGEECDSFSNACANFSCQQILFKEW